jgi:hypothetical protein
MYTNKVKYIKHVKKDRMYHKRNRYITIQIQTGSNISQRRNKQEQIYQNWNKQGRIYHQECRDKYVTAEAPTREICESIFERSRLHITMVEVRGYNRYTIEGSQQERYSSCIFIV